MPRKRKPRYEDDTDYSEESEGGGGARRRRPPAKKAAAGGKERRCDEYGATVAWRPKASAAVQQRIARAMPGGHRLFLIDRKQLRAPGAAAGAAEEFAVLGATGNVYTVTIAAHPRCSCPDAAKGNICKHRLFVMLRVLHLPRDEPLVWQAALLPSEADAVLAGQKSLERSVGGGDVLAGAAVREAYRRASTGGDEGGEQGGGGGPPRALEGDCPVCFDALASGEAVSWCAGCRNNVHRECIGHWLKSQRQRGGDASCPLCRAAWVDGSQPAAAGGAGAGDEYLNLAVLSAAHAGADTSLEALYGDRAVWIQASQGLLPRSTAAARWRAAHHG